MEQETDARNDENIDNTDDTSNEAESQEEAKEEEQSDEKQFDFAGELKRMETSFDTKLSKMQKAIARDKFKQRQDAKKEEPKPVIVEDESDPDDFDARYERKREEERQTERMTTAETAVGKLTTDADEAKLILRYVETMPPGGELEEDIENAWILANKGRIKAQSSLFLKKLQSMNLSGAGSYASNDKANEGGGGKLTQADEQRLTGLGFKKTKSGRWESPHQIAVIKKDGTIETKRKAK